MGRQSLLEENQVKKTNCRCYCGFCRLRHQQTFAMWSENSGCCLTQRSPRRKVVPTESKKRRLAKGVPETRMAATGPIVLGCQQRRHRQTWRGILRRHLPARWCRHVPDTTNGRSVILPARPACHRIGLRMFVGLSDVILLPSNNGAHGSTMAAHVSA